MLVVAALGGSALTRRGELLTAEGLPPHIRRIAASLAPLATGNQLVITHGHGPQMAHLALQGAAYAKIEAYPAELPGARTEAVAGCMLEQELTNLLPSGRPVATVLATAQVDRNDPAFRNPSKYIGPEFLREEAERLSALKGWVFKPDGDKRRRVVASPEPTAILQTRSIRCLLERDTVVIVKGGGGIPATYEGMRRHLTGVECVVDPDLASAVLARELRADLLVLLSETDAVYLDDGRPCRNPIRRASPEALASVMFGLRSVSPQVRAACRFAETTGKRAAIGSITELPMILAGKAGTTISVNEPGITYAASMSHAATA